MKSAFVYALNLSQTYIHVQVPYYHVLEKPRALSPYHTPSVTPSESRLTFCAPSTSPPPPPPPPQREYSPQHIYSEVKKNTALQKSLSLMWNKQVPYHITIYCCCIIHPCPSFLLLLLTWNIFIQILSWLLPVKFTFSGGSFMKTLTSASLQKTDTSTY